MGSSGRLPGGHGAGSEPLPAGDATFAHAGAYDERMRARPAVLVLASLAACAAPSSSKTERAPESPAQRARPEADPVLLGTPPGAPAVLPIEQVSVRVRRLPDGQLTIVEFVSPGLPPEEQVRLRLALEAGKLRLAAEGQSGEESWVTTLLRPSAR